MAVSPVDGPSLWLPRSMAEEGPPQLPMRTAITVGAHELLGHSGTVAEVSDLLAEYSLGEVLEFLGRVSSVLFEADAKDRLSAQLAVLDGALGPGTALRDEYMRQRARHIANGADEAVVFHQAQLLLTAKVALLTLPPALERDTNRPLNHLVAALLLVNDLLQSLPAEFANLGEDSTEAAGRRIMFLLANGLFHQSRNRMQDLVRSYDLLLGADDPGLRSRVERATGVAPEEYLFALVGVHAHFSGITQETAASRSATLDRGTYFSAKLKLSPDESRSLVDLVAAPVEVVQEEVRALYSLDDLRPYQFLPLARHPLVSFGDDAICVSLHLLHSKVTSGLYYLHLDRDAFTPSETGAYQRSLGDRFGGYVASVLRGVYPDFTRRLVDDDRLKRAIGDQSRRADCVCLFGDRVLIVEAKASPFPLDVRAGLNFAGLQGKVESVFVRAMEQIVETVKWLRREGRGEFDIPDAAAYLPLVVTLDELPMNPWLYGMIEERLRAEGLWGAFPGAPFQAMDIDELEMMEGLIEASGMSLVDLIALKCANGRGVSFRSYFADHHPDWMREAGASSMAEARFGEITQELFERIRSLRKESDVD